MKALVAFGSAELGASVSILDNLPSRNDHRIHALEKEWIVAGQALLRRGRPRKPTYGIDGNTASTADGTESAVPLVSRACSWPLPSELLLLFDLGSFRGRFPTPEEREPSVES
jgi:hypothetical protein